MKMASNLGIKGSQIGYDVFSTRDYLQMFNSSWPHLKVSSTGVYSGSVGHGLGYVPFFLIASSADGRVSFNSGDSFSMDNVALQLYSGSDTPRYYIFRLDIEQNFTADTVDGTTSQGSIDTNRGFKLTKIGADINSTDMRNFSLHSSTVAPLVHMVRKVTMVNTGGGLGYEYTLNHNLGYTPTAFAFLKPGTNSLGQPVGKYTYVMPPVGVSGRYYTTNSTSVYVTADSSYYSDAPEISIVVLKNPYTLRTVNRTFP